MHTLGFLRHPNLQTCQRIIGWGDEGTPTWPTKHLSAQLLKNCDWRAEDSGYLLLKSSLSSQIFG